MGGVKLFFLDFLCIFLQFSPVFRAFRPFSLSNGSFSGIFRAKTGHKNCASSCARSPPRSPSMMQDPRCQRTKQEHDELIWSIRPTIHDVAALGHFLPELIRSLVGLPIRKTPIG
jgi:hypothetical protein